MVYLDHIIIIDLVVVKLGLLHTLNLHGSQGGEREQRSAAALTKPWILDQSKMKAIVNQDVLGAARYRAHVRERPGHRDL